MRLSRKKLTAIGGIGIVAIAIFVAAQSWWPDPNETGEQSRSSVNRMDSASADRVQTTRELQPGSQEKTEIDARLRGQLASMPPVSLDEYRTATDALQSIAAWSDMSAKDLQQNALRWKEACRHVRMPTGVFPIELETESYRSALEEFESFCSGIESFKAANAPRIESAADVDEIFDRIDSAIASRRESWPDKIERLGREGALEAAFDRLRTAIRNVDELQTQAAIMSLTGSGLYPQIEETGPRSEWFLDGLSFPLANALLCQRLDGCRGPAHPYVVKYCLMEHQNRNRVCDSPSSIDDAIYQTLTPVEFENYLQLYGWLTSQLARWSG